MIPNSSKLAEIQERGFAVVPRIISRDDVARLKPLLQQCIQEDLEKWKGTPYQDKWMVMALMSRHVEFARLMENTLLQQYLGALLGEMCIVYAYTSSSMPPNDGNYSCRVHVDCPRIIPGYTTNVGVIVALDDFTAENGATYFLPGSHTRALAPSRDEFMQFAERAYPEAGDAVFFNARTWHMGGTNRTDRPRHSVTINACRSYMRQQLDFPRLVPAEIVEQLTDVGRRFLGFNVRVPASLEEYYVPEEQRLYKANQG